MPCYKALRGPLRPGESAAAGGGSALPLPPGAALLRSRTALCWAPPTIAGGKRRAPRGFPPGQSAHAVWPQSSPQRCWSFYLSTYNGKLYDLSLKDFVFQLQQEPAWTREPFLNKLLERCWDQYGSELLTPDWVLRAIPSRRSPPSLQAPLKSKCYRFRKLQTTCANCWHQNRECCCPSASGVPDSSSNPHFTCEVGRILAWSWDLTAFSSLLPNSKVS